MDPVHIQITSAMIDALKHALRKEFPKVGPGHLSEALAAGLGYATYAALLSLGEGGWSSFDPVAFNARLASMGLPLAFGLEAMNAIRSVVASRGFGEQVEGLLAREDISEIIFLGDGMVFLGTMGKLTKSEPGLSEKEIRSLMRRFALDSGKKYGAIIEGVHPRGFSFAGIDTPISPDGPTLTIRKKMPSLRMEHLVSAGMLSAPTAAFLQGRIDSTDKTPIAWGINRNSQFLSGNILITGGRSSGKSLLLGALLMDLRPDLDVILVQGPNGIKLNRPGLRTGKHWETKSSDESCEGYVLAATRHKGNGLIVADFGEDPAASVAMLHMGSAFTMHSFRPDEALAKLLGWITKSYKMSRTEAVSILASRIDIVVQTCRRKDGSCRLEGVYRVQVVDGNLKSSLLFPGNTE